jgi:cell division protein FtsZ
MGILTVAVITQPFGFEGKRRLQQAERGLKELLDSVDTMIVIPNEKLLAVAKDAGFFESFRIADDVLRQGVQGISDIITIPGIINRDFADVKTTMAGMGHAVMGTAVRSGENRAIEAAQAAMASPMLEKGAIDGARGILINITGSSALKLSEVNVASSLIQSSAHEDANIIFGAVLDERMGDEVKITVIATGFKDQMPERRARMLSVEEAPILSVPVVAADSWLREPSAPAQVHVPEPEPELVMAHAAPEPPRPRFMSEEDEEELVTAMHQPATLHATQEPETAISIHMDEVSFAEPVATAPRFAEPSAHASQPNGNGLRHPSAPSALEERRPLPTGNGLFEENADRERDLEVPTFMRRSPLF